MYVMRPAQLKLQASSGLGTCSSRHGGAVPIEVSATAPAPLSTSAPAPVGGADSFMALTYVLPKVRSFLLLGAVRALMGNRVEHRKLTPQPSSTENWRRTLGKGRSGTSQTRACQTFGL